jgi:hypothetical protein
MCFKHSKIAQEEENPFFSTDFSSKLSQGLFGVGSNSQPDSLCRQNLYLHATHRKEREEDGHFLCVCLWNVGGRGGGDEPILMIAKKPWSSHLVHGLTRTVEPRLDRSI